MVAKVVWIDGRYSFAAGADVAPGEIVTRPCGSLAIHDGPELVKSGKQINPWPIKPCQIVRFDSASATTFAAGASVYMIPSTKLVTGVSTDNVYVGKATQAKVSGQLSAMVNTSA